MKTILNAFLYRIKTYISTIYSVYAWCGYQYVYPRLTKQDMWTPVSAIPTIVH